MITLLQDRTLHSLRLNVENIKDRLTALFYSVISCFDNTWEDTGKFYSYKAYRRNFVLNLFPNEIIQVSSNQFLPHKAFDVLPPTDLDPKKYMTYEPKPKAVRWQGLCSGICVDHMRRVKSSKKGFIESIKECAQKFSQGSSKKGYKYHHILRQIRTTNEFFEKKSYKTVGKIFQTKLEDNPFDFAKKGIEVFMLNIRKKHLQHILKEYSTKFVTNNLNLNYNELSDGDYFLYQEVKNEPGHAICLYKRKDSLIVFDPNYGTLLFKTSERFSHFLTLSMKESFCGKQPSINIFQCKDKKK